VPAAAVIPALKVYIKIVAVKKFVVSILNGKLFHSCQFDRSPYKEI
jgi:hypothetical protein